jgi:branched-chain amino acid transport system substrate-binding protein
MTTAMRRHRWLALVLALLLVAGACGRDDGDDDASSDTTAAESDEGSEEMAEPSPGITDDSIKIGATYPLSGPASAYAVISQALDSCFADINDQGGIEMADGKTRTVEFIIKDDGYDPAQASANAQALVEQDEVFMILNPLGTGNNMAIRDYMNAQEVPQAFVASGASAWGAQHEEFPWTSGWQPSYPTESSIYAQFLVDEFPDGATVAVLYQNDAYGDDYVHAFETAIEGTNIEIIATESYESTDPSIESQMVNLAQSGADVFFNVTTPAAAVQAIRAVGESSWEPLHLLNSVSNSKVGVLTPAGLENADGIYTTLYLKDPSDQQWADDEAMVAYFASAEEFGDFEPLNGFGAFGYSVCETTRNVLEDMSEPTRAAFQETADNMEYELPLGLPGVSVKTGEGDAFPIEAMQIAQFNNETWELQGEVLDFEGETPIPEAMAEEEE